MIDYYSLECLQRRVTLFVQNQQEQPNPPKLCIAIAGGGGHLLSTIASTPGASSTLIEGTTAYSREAFQDYIQREMNFDFDLQSFKYCSAEAAIALSDAACRRALYLSTSKFAQFSDPSVLALETKQNWTSLLRGAVGVAVTSVLQSTTVSGYNADGSPIRSSRRSIETSGSRAFCAVQTSTGVKVQFCARLSRSTVSNSFSNTRSRLDEDVFVSHCLLSCILLSQMKSFDDVIDFLGLNLKDNPLQEDDKNECVLQWTSAHGDDMKVALHAPLVKSFQSTENVLYVDKILRQAAERILKKREEVVMILLPNDVNNTVEVLHTTMLPPHSLVVPGSFNPPHVGHISLAQAAAKEMTHQCSSIWFELSITNADKPALSVETVIDRIKYFFEFRDDLPSDICWGILLTNAPLFKQKVDLLSPLQLKSSNSILHFSIGTDTLVRLINPKYYNYSEDDMLLALKEMNCHFIVGGRLDQARVSESVFISGEQVIEQLPFEFQSKFTIIPKFRIDCSSTEIRKKIAADYNAMQ